MSRRAVVIFCSCAGVLAAAGYVHPYAAGPQAPRAQAANAQTRSTAASGTPEPRAFIKEYCVTCHNERLKTAGLFLDKMDASNVGASGDVWEKVVLKIRSGAMPPVTAKRPDKATLDAFASGLEHALDREAAVHPNPGRPAEHRLNQVEYGNAIRDLLALEIDPTSMVPADESDHGFDNIAEVLSISSTLLERYLFAAKKISRLAVGDMSMGPAIETFQIPRGVRQNERMSDDLPYGTRGGTLVHYYFPLDGEYVVKIRLQRNFTDNSIRAIDTREQVDILLDGALVKRINVGGECNGAAAREDPKCKRNGYVVPTSEYESTADQVLTARFPVTAGMRALGATFVKKSTLVEGPAPVVLPPRHTSSTYEAPEMDMESVRLEGPYNPTGPGDTPSRERIFVCRPARPAEEDACAKTILTTLARRAYRRPVTDRDVETLRQFYKAGRSEGNFDRGIQDALTRLLVSPQFLFRVERDPTDVRRGPAYRISDVELASRLAFFLWSSSPDDPLLDLAARGKLKDPRILEEQVRRMLADARATALVNNFGGQWLYLRNMKAVDPDPRRFPEFDDNLREAFQRETQLFLESQMRDDRPLEELLTANYTFLNERLARFYGVKGVYGTHFRRVALIDPRRAGLLGQGSILTVTSYATRTSPVLRGKYLLDNILGAPPPPPPPNVPPFKEAPASGQALGSMRERMEAHRQNAICATCHQRMDPLGFALENFDAIGKWRTTEGNSAIDASGVLPDGTKFGGPEEFRTALMAHRDEFVRTFTEKLTTYALGRAVQYYDMPSLRGIIREAAPTNYRWSSLILGIVRSQPFQMRKAQELTTTDQQG